MITGAESYRRPDRDQRPHHGGRRSPHGHHQAVDHLIPPQADSYWVGEAGPGPSYLDDNRGGANHWTTRNAAFEAWNMLHAARLLKDAGGIPAHGNVTTNWDLSVADHPNPEYR